MTTFDKKLARVIIQIAYTIDKDKRPVAAEILKEIEGHEIEIFGEDISEKNLRKKILKLINKRYLGIGIK